MFFLDRSKSQVQALDAWREAERLVSDRWALFVDAEPGARQFAFASYVAALDAEEAAAAELALTADHQTALSADRLAA
jgi:uncharacterized damage-inducible protein DinB